MAKRLSDAGGVPPKIGSMVEVAGDLVSHPASLRSFMRLTVPPMIFDQGRRTQRDADYGEQKAQHYAGRHLIAPLGLPASWLSSVWMWR
jgi:hypothetical protein